MTGRRTTTLYRWGRFFKGIEGVRGFYLSIAAALPDLKVEGLTEYDVDGCSIREVVISGRHMGDCAGVKRLTFDTDSGKPIL